MLGWSKFFQQCALYSALCTGMVVALVRTMEPYFHFLIKQEFFSWFGLILNEKEQNNAKSHEKDSIANFLSASLNVELVNAILYALSNKMSGVAKSSFKAKRFTR